jgi:gluconate 5-dehydrogenase
VIPQMIGNGGGRIVNVASIAGILALKNRIAYASSKAGVIGMTKAMALELGEHGINVNAVAPGVIETPLIASYFEDPELAQAIVEAIPVGRWGQPADLVGPIAFLCGPDAEYVSGQTLAVDGAWTAGKGY